MFRGSIVAIVTPFRDGKLDLGTLEKLVEMHVAAGTAGIVPCGTTGESATLSHDEHRRVIETVIKKVEEILDLLDISWSDIEKVSTSILDYLR